MASFQRITPCLWFDDQAEEAARYYTGIFDDSRIVAISRYGEAGFEVHHRPAGSVMVVVFELAGQRFQAFNGGPGQTFTEAISFVVHCDSQQEVDHFWNGLTANGGQEVECGWLRDRFGVRWQIVPTRFFELMSDNDPKKRAVVFEAMMHMKKFDIAGLEAAHAKA